MNIFEINQLPSAFCTSIKAIHLRLVRSAANGFGLGLSTVHQDTAKPGKLCPPPSSRALDGHEPLSPVAFRRGCPI